MKKAVLIVAGLLMGAANVAHAQIIEPDPENKSVVCTYSVNGRALTLRYSPNLDSQDMFSIVRTDTENKIEFNLIGKISYAGTGLGLLSIRDMEKDMAAVSSGFSGRAITTRLLTSTSTIQASCAVK